MTVTIEIDCNMCKRIQVSASGCLENRLLPLLPFLFRSVGCAVALKLGGFFHACGKGRPEVDWTKEPVQAFFECWDFVGSDGNLVDVLREIVAPHPHACRD